MERISKIIIFYTLIIIFLSCNNENISEQYIKYKKNINIANNEIYNQINKPIKTVKYELGINFDFFEDQESLKKLMEDNNVIYIGYRKYDIPNKIIISDYLGKIPIKIYIQVIDKYYQKISVGEYILRENIPDDKKELLNEFFYISQIQGNDDYILRIIDKLLTTSKVKTDFFIPLYTKKYVYYQINYDSQIYENNEIILYNGKFGINKLSNKNMLIIDSEMKDGMIFRVIIDLS